MAHSERRCPLAPPSSHLHNDDLVLYDLTSSYFEGVTCPLAARGKSRDRKKNTLQVNYGLDAPSLWPFSNFGGDSGGALFAGDGSSFELVGLSTGFDTGCAEHLIEGRYVDIRNYPGLEMLDDIFCDADCSEPDSPSHEVLLAVELAYVADDGEDRHPIRIGDGATELLVNLNHETAGFRPESATNLSMMLPASLEGECSRYYGVESCHISNPPPGAYSIGIQRESGNPAYQLTVVAIYEE